MGRCPVQSCVVRWIGRKRKNADKLGWGQQPKGSAKPAAAEEVVEEDGSSYQTRKEKSRVVRVKMVLTKAEVARLLAVGVSATEEAVVEHLATALERLGRARPGGPWRPALESIPESA